MPTTQNHLVLSRRQLAEASEHADAGSTALARTHLLFAADHALIALAARSAVDLTPAYARLDRVEIAALLTEIGAAPDDVAPVLRDLGDDSVDCIKVAPLGARLTVGFGLVQALIDANLAHAASTSPPARMRLYGGAGGALNARGAEAAVRGLARVAAAIRAVFRR
jgi:hypothetical protein